MLKKKKKREIERRVAMRKIERENEYRKNALVAPSSINREKASATVRGTLRLGVIEVVVSEEKGSIFEG